MSSSYYILEKIDNTRTRLTLNYYIRKSIASGIIFKLTHKKKMEAMFQKSLQNLGELLKEIRFALPE